jgi:type 1 glutamine amidotransferase
MDVNKDGSLTKDELTTTTDKWFASADTTKTGTVTREQLAAALDAVFPAPPPAPAPDPAAVAAQPGGARGGGRGAAQAEVLMGADGRPLPPQPAPRVDPCGGRAHLPTVGQTPCPDDVTKMLAALPATAPAKPARARKILVLGNAQGFVHSSIPLAARMVEEMGKKYGTWTTTITYDPADINAKNLAQYDAVFLSSTTGCFLDAKPTEQGMQAAPKAEVDARRSALISFVRGGKGLAGIHATGDSYHSTCPTAEAPPAGRGAGGGGGRGGAGTPGASLAATILRWSDKNIDAKVTKDEIAALPDLWFNKLDPSKSGKVSQADFATRFASITGVGAPGPDSVKGSWPDYDKMIGGFFKFHWVDPQLITVKIDDPKSPLTAMFKGQAFEVHDETYTFGMDTFSRENLHILTSIDYSKMSDDDKMKEGSPRPDHDYGLSWIKKDGNGRVFYEAHGHSERIYAMPNMMAHMLAGIQYALGDLNADDSPTVKAKK